MKKLLCVLLTAALLAGCTAVPAGTTAQTAAPLETDAVRIVLSDEEVQFPENSGVEVVREAAHTLVRITEPGGYVLTGQLTEGQIAVDLGENAKDDPDAVVYLVLDDAEITCRTAPAILFDNVYECGEPGLPAGANLILKEGTENLVVGSHTEEYDGAVYSRMSMTVSDSGSLRIYGDNEGLCSEMHLTIHSGDISIESGNDGINANADGVSVVTVSGGHLRIAVTGATGEGDGIDSNGSIVISGGHVEAYACADSADSGIDADLGIRITGGTVIATGNMLDRIDDGGQTYAVFTFAQTQSGSSYTLKNEAGTVLFDITPPNAFSSLLLSGPELTEGTYTLWSGDTRLEGMAQSGGFFGNMQPIERPEWPGRGDGDVEIPPQPTMPIVTQGTVQPPAGEQPENMPVPPMPENGGSMPTPPLPEGSEAMPMPEPPAGVESGEFGRQPVNVLPATGVISEEFPIKQGANYFYMVRPVA